MNPESKVSNPILPQRLNWRKQLSASAIFYLTKILMATWRYEWKDDSNLFQGEKGPIIFGVWHNRLAISMPVYFNYVLKRRPAPLAAVISASNDGALLAQVLKKFSVQSVRGSSSRRGQQALLEATTWIEKGYHVAITPDGPRGPRYRVQSGIISLAQLSGRPIVPVSSFIKSKLSTRSWDRFQIPWPWARCEIRLGKPIYVSRDASESEREEQRDELEKRLMELTKD